MRIVANLATAAVVGTLVAMVVLMIQLASSFTANYADSGLRWDYSLVLPALIGMFVGTGTMVLQSTGSGRRRRRRRTP